MQSKRAPRGSADGEAALVDIKLGSVVRDDAPLAVDALSILDYAAAASAAATLAALAAHVGGIEHKGRVRVGADKEEGAWPRLTKGATTPEPSADEDPLMRRAVEADARTLRKRRAMNEVLGTEACAAAEAIYKMLRARAPFGKIASALSNAPDNVCACRLQSHGTLLHTACDERRSDVVKVLLGHSDVDARNARLFTPLHLCAGALASLPRPSPKDAEAAASCASLLLDKGANPSLLDDAGRAPLHLACLQMGTLRIVEALIEGGADPTQQTTDGWLAVDAAHTVGALTDELRRILTPEIALKAPAGHSFVDDVDD